MTLKKEALPVVFCVALATLCMIGRGQEKRSEDDGEDNIAVSPRSQGQESSASEDSREETWGKIIEAPPEVFFAADLSDEVRKGLTNTLLVATAEWGNYGPLEYWVLGTDHKAAKELTELYCDRRSQLGQYEKSQCLSDHLDDHKSHHFEHYRQVGADALESGRPKGSMGRNGSRGWGIHLFTSSYPLGFDKLFGSNPAEEQKTVFHEYFHAVQHAHIQSSNHDDRRALMGPIWFVEGGAEYMAQTTARKLWASGTLPTIDNHDLKSIEQTFENKMKNGRATIKKNCPGIKLGDIAYGHDCETAAYDLGAWAIGYLLIKAGQTALLDTFYPSLNEFGWEGAFKKTFGMSSKDFYEEFNLFLEIPLADQLALLPQYP